METENQCYESQYVDMTNFKKINMRHRKRSISLEEIYISNLINKSISEQIYDSILNFNNIDNKKKDSASYETILFKSISNLCECYCNNCCCKKKAVNDIKLSKKKRNIFKKIIDIIFMRYQ